VPTTENETHDDAVAEHDEQAKEEEEEEEIEDSNTASLQIPTYSIIIIFQFNVEHKISSTEHELLLSELCNFCSTNYSVSY
jgi:hypothetical protein